jgi:glycosyltransferase involved in cell wall biosynthesis
MKALIISAAFPPLRTGGADFVHRLCSELVSRNVEVSVLGPASALSLDSSLVIHRIKTNWNWQAAEQCISLINSTQPDVVDIVFTGWMYHDHPMITFLPTLIKKRCPNVRIILHVESLGGILRSKNNLIRATSRYLASLVAGRENLSFEYGSLLRDSDAIITLSDRDRDELCKRDPMVSKKSVTIPPPPIMPVTQSLNLEERNARRLDLGLAKDDLVLSFYGYVYPGKGLEVLLESVKILVQAGQDVKLIVVGDTPEQYVLEREGKPNYLEDLRSLAANLEIGDRIRWSQYAPYGSLEPSTKLRLSDICVFPFLSGINLHNSSFWFAAAHGLPIVATKSSSTECQFSDRENVLFCAPGDADDLAAKITQLSQDLSLSRTIGSGAAALTNETFSWRTCVDRTIELYTNGFVDSAT